MDQIEDRQHVLVRSRFHGTYIHADEDGHGVSLSRELESISSVWIVHRINENAQQVLLHSAAYGRYLAATATSAPLGCSGFCVEQKDFNQIEEAVTWQVVRPKPQEETVLLRHAAANGYQYLRANGNHVHIRWNEGAVSVDDMNTVNTMFHWVVVPIASSQHIPRLPRPHRLCTRLREGLDGLLWTRSVRCEGQRGSFSFQFSGTSLSSLRSEVIKKLQSYKLAYNITALYVRAGTYGRLTPLVVDLPRSREELTLAEPPANIVPQYPEFDAE